MFRTKTGDLSLYVRAFEVLGKSLQPLPDKWHGLHDIEKRYRRRYVDLTVNPHVRDVMIARSRIVAEMRRFIDAQGFFEVETPTLLNDRRRRVRAAVPHALQRARHRARRCASRPSSTSSG